MNVEIIAHTKVLVVGSGGNGVSAAVMFLNAGVDDLRIITKHTDFGGCWLQNRYPGCATDTKMAHYQFSYAISPDWSGTHASAEELTAYMQRTAAQYGLYEKTDFETEMLEATWLEDKACWSVRTNRGVYLADYLVPVTGFLEEPVIPPIANMENFKGRIFHSSEWPEGYTAEGDRVAVVGTGSSSLQIVPEMQKVASKLLVFQRTPNHIKPREYRAWTEAEREEFRRNPELLAQMRKEAGIASDTGWINGFLGFADDETAVERAAWEYLNRAVADPVLREKLTPKHTFACKRPGSSDDFYQTLQKPNVELVAEAASSLGEHTITSASGLTFDVDTVVFATGFIFGGTILDKIRRRDGQTVGEHQKSQRRAYKSVSVANCPNLFLVGGSGPNGQIWNGLAPGEVVPGYAVLAMKYMEENGVRAMEVKEEAEIEWKRRADEILKRSPAAAGTCVNYSQDAEGNNKAAWPGGIASYTEAMTNFIVEDYIAVANADAVTPQREEAVH